MSVTVDNRPLPADRLGLTTVGHVLRHLRQRDRLVVHVLIDGKEPDLRRMKTVQRSFVAGHTIFIETAEPRELAGDVLDQIESQLAEADRLQNECARLLARSQFAPAIEKLGGCFTLWRHMQETVVKTAQLLRLDLGSIQVNGRALDVCLDDCKQHLTRIRGALDERDFGRLASLLAGSAPPNTANWRDALQSLRGKIAQD